MTWKCHTLFAIVERDGIIGADSGSLRTPVHYHHAGRSENSALTRVLYWWSMRTNIFKHTQMTNTLKTTMILHYYILY